MLPQILIVDLDGTLALIGDRSPYAAEHCERDSLNKPVANFMDNWSTLYREEERQIILMSGRQELHRPQTEKWLDDNEIVYDALFMRATGDNRNDAIVKRELFDAHIRDKFDVYLVLDDRTKVVRMWREELGLTCWQVAASPD